MNTPDTNQQTVPIHRIDRRALMKWTGASVAALAAGPLFDISNEGTDHVKRMGQDFPEKREGRSS